MNRVRMLIHFGVIPYLVFDGDYLPSKASTEVEREKKRGDSRKMGLELLRLGKTSQAQLELQKAVDVTPEMARQLIDELKITGVQYVVAPYEADAQLAYLEKKGIIQGILSEDSDLLVFGAKKLLTKLDQYGDCIEINRNDFTSCREISLVGWTDADFRRMAILSGCDYLANMNKMGLKTAYRLVRKYKTLEKIIRMLQFDGQYHVPTGYIEAFQQAELTFLHQRVFCPIAGKNVMINSLPPNSNPDDFDFAGRDIEQDVAVGVAHGDLHPTTKKPLVTRRCLSRSLRTPLGISKRQTCTTSSDLKPNKSIESFFKTKRVPLAELDPNSFTPSPSQQQLLFDQGNETWNSSPAPGRSSLSRSSISLPLAPSQSVTRQERTISSNFSMPSPAFNKRRRLCPDPSEASETPRAAKIEMERSRFFTPSLPGDRSSTNGSRKNRKQKKSEINIWSDDSIEEAMAELPDFSASQKAPSKGALKIFRDKPGEAEDDHRSQELGVDIVQQDSQSLVSSRSTARSEISISTSATSIPVSDESQTLVKSLDEHVRSELAALTKECLYQPESERCRTQRQSISQSLSQPPPKPTLLRQRSMTPLQRLGAGAMDGLRSFSPSINRNEDLQKSGSENNSISQAIVAQTPSIDTAQKREPKAIRGSEDSIIPDSEAESEEELSEDGRDEKRTFDLGRFAFTG